jgi:hypothetical protein
MVWLENWLRKSAGMLFIAMLMYAIVWAASGKGDGSVHVALAVNGSPTTRPRVAPTATPTATAAPTATATPTPTRLVPSGPYVPPPSLPDALTVLPPTSTPLFPVTFPLTAPLTINDLPFGSIVTLSDTVKLRMREIYALGQSLGNNPRAFSKVGDSVISNPYFVAPFDAGAYNLGAYAFLQPAIAYYAGSFARASLAVRTGLNSYTMLNPAWADKALCLANETPIACELRVQRPSVVLVRVGSNDVGDAKGFEQNLRTVLDLAIRTGVIPVLGTKADRHEGDDNTNNLIVRRLAGEYNLPLWDFDAVAATLPDRGLGSDLVHLTNLAPDDYTQPEAFQRGHPLQNLTALLVLEELRQVLNAP